MNPRSTIDGRKIKAMLKAGTHVLMPVKADGDMSEAIWKYYANTVRYKRRPQSDACKADCWMALMAYYAMVEVVKHRPLIDRAK